MRRFPTAAIVALLKTGVSGRSTGSNAGAESKCADADGGQPAIDYPKLAADAFGISRTKQKVKSRPASEATSAQRLSDDCGRD